MEALKLKLLPISLLDALQKTTREGIEEVGFDVVRSGFQHIGLLSVNP